MKNYSVYLCDGTFIDIEAEGWYIEDDMIFFIEVQEDEMFNIRVAFTVQNVFCKSEFPNFADKNGESCISVLEKVADRPAALPRHCRNSTADMLLS